MSATDEDSESDIELPTALLNKKKMVKIAPKSPTTEMLSPKKLSTKAMVQQALIDLKSRKGVSLYAIKKYIDENYQTKPERIGYYIKKYIKSGMEAGTIIQTKGVGVTGSFKLAAIKPEKKKKISKPLKEKTRKEKTRKEKLAKDKEPKEKITKKKEETQAEEKIKKPKKMEKNKKINEETSPPKLVKVMKRKKIGKEDTKKSTKSKLNAKTSKAAKTPTKKKATMMKRKSIGSIIKPPKMNPKGKA